MLMRFFLVVLGLFVVSVLVASGFVFWYKYSSLGDRCEGFFCKSGKKIAYFVDRFSMGSLGYNPYPNTVWYESVDINGLGLGRTISVYGMVTKINSEKVELSLNTGQEITIGAKKFLYKYYDSASVSDLHKFEGEEVYVYGELYRKIRKGSIVSVVWRLDGAVADSKIRLPDNLLDTFPYMIVIYKK